MFVVLAVIFVGGGFYIFEYNNFVNVRHERNALKSSISEKQSVNADLKNQLYGEIDPANLETLANGSNLILEKKPQYLND